MTQADDNQAKAASSVAKSRRRVQFRVAIGHFFIAGIDSRSSRFLFRSPAAFPRHRAESTDLSLTASSFWLSFRKR
jgi:hypothetical protein